MIEYIYIVKCPGCEDEMFNFFTDARMQCDLLMSKKPSITQVEVERNDFGECTDHHDLGTVWSWEEAMKDTEGGYTDAEPTKSLFTKDDLKLMADGKDPEFDNIDNSVDFEPVTSKVSSTERKPIPEGMTIEELVEEMEENEDTVECTWCEELFDKSECRKEVNLGWLCSRCEMAIKSRGETLTFRENNYWDFLDEAAELKEASLSDIAAVANSEFGTNYSERDILDTIGVEDEEYFDDIETFSELQAERKRVGKETAIKARATNKLEELEPEAVHDLGTEYDGGYPNETSEVSDSHLKLCPECGKETFDLETGICVECGFN